MPDLSCDLCEQEIAVMLNTNLGNGESLAVGGGCLLAWAENFVKSLKEAIAAAHPPGGPESPAEPPEAEEGMTTYLGTPQPGKAAGSHAHGVPEERGGGFVHRHKDGGKPHAHPLDDTRVVR